MVTTHHLIHNASDAEILALAQSLSVAFKLKRTMRYSTERDRSVHSESVAEHVFALVYLAFFFFEFEDPHHNLNREKVFSLILFHDFGEIKHGDVPYHLKTANDEDRESEAAREIFDSLPNKLGTLGYDGWLEYKKHESPEALFVYALDKIEPLWEMRGNVNEKSMHRLKFTYEMHIERKRKATEKFPVMRRFVEVMSDDMLKRNVFWKE